MARRSVVLVILAAVVLAGCTGAPGSEVTTSESSGTEALTTTEDEQRGAQIPGIIDGSLRNATALVRANEEALSETGGQVTVQSADTETELRFNLTVGDGLTTSALKGTHSPGNGETTTHYWSNKTTTFIRTQASGEPRYQAIDRQQTSLQPLRMIEVYLAASAFTVANESTDDGTVVLTADEVHQSNAGDGPFSDVTSLTGRLVVRQTGHIQNLSVSAATDNGTITYQYDLVKHGVEEAAKPGWVNEIPESAMLQPDLSINVRNNSYFRIENQGGDHVPSNANLTISTDKQRGTASFDTVLDAGETRYAYFDSVEESLQLTTERPSPDVQSPITSPASVIITADEVTLQSVSMAWGSSSATANETEASVRKTAAKKAQSAIAIAD